MKTNLQNTLALSLPFVIVETFWSLDYEALPSHSAGADLWLAEIRASAIQAGELLSVSECLYSVEVPIGDHPAISNPTISGYEEFMTTEALKALGQKLSDRALGNIVTGAAERLEHPLGVL